MATGTYPYILSEMRKKTFSSVYNMQRQGGIRYGTFLNDEESAKSKIYANYTKQYEKEMKEKTGRTGSDFLKDSALGKIYAESVASEIKNYNLKRDIFKKSGADLRSFLKDYGVSEKDNNEAIAELRKLQQSVQGLLDTLSEIPDLFATSNPRDYIDDSKPIVSASGSSVSNAFRLDSSSNTAIQTLEGYIKSINGTLEKMEKYNKKGTLFDFRDVKIKRPPTKNKNLSSHVELGKLYETIGGSLNSVSGFILENAVANGAQKSINDGASLFREVFLTGADTTQIAEIKSKSGKDLGELKYVRAKSDIKVKDSGGEIFGISAKNQSAAKKDSISLSSSTLPKILDLIGNSETSKLTFLKNYSVYYDDKYEYNGKTVRKKMNLFIATLSADYAVGAGGDDRVHFIVDKEKIVPLGDFYEVLRKRLSVQMVNPGLDRDSSKSEVQAVLGGSVPINYSI